jgi:hypothetical protein
MPMNRAERMKRRREMGTMSVGEMDELAKTYGSEDSNKSADGENMREFWAK